MVTTTLPLFPSLSEGTASSYNECLMARINTKVKKISQRLLLITMALLVFAGLITTYAVSQKVQKERQQTNLAAQAAELVYPADLLDLSYWKLTLPINDAQEIKQPDLAIYSTQYMQLNSQKNGVTFMSPAGGDTTGGSNYARSELRERRVPNNEYSFDVADCPAKDKPNEACWSSYAGYHIMTIDQAITHIPVLKPEVVVGQIHDKPDDVVVFRLDNKRLYINIDTDRFEGDDITLTNSYELGTRFTVAFEVEKNITNFYYNGTYVGKMNGRYNGGYFKAGMYVQSNEAKTAKNNEYGQVDIFNLQFCHAADKGGCSTVQPKPPGAGVQVATVVPTSIPTLQPSPVITATPNPTVRPTPTQSATPTSSPLPSPTPQATPGDGKISGLKVSSPKDSKVVVTWNANPSVAKYRVLMSKSSLTNFKVVETTTKTRETFELPSCKNFYFKVYGYNKDGKKIATSDIAGVLVSIGNPVHPCE